MVFQSNFFNSESEATTKNTLIEYLQKQQPETLEMIAQSASPEIREIITHNVQGLVGMLPVEGFNVQIMTDRQNLANLLASAMMTGYFLSQMEKRKDLEQNLADTDSI
jgi:23S rRNA G2069 N7-methylase RlmK/C1962 C5-methylase RlmI